MINIRAKVAVFCGKVDQRRDPGWYWTSVPGPGEPLKGPYNGPFKTKAEAVEDANQAAVIEEKAQDKLYLLTAAAQSPPRGSGRC